MTPPAPRARIAPLDLLFVRPIPAPTAARSRRVALGILAAVTALGAAVRLSSLGAQSFSASEAAYVRAARGAAWNLHGVLLGATSTALGATDAALRLPSAIAGIATVPLLYVVLRHLAPRGVALACAALLSIAPLHVAASQDARPFAIALLLALGLVHAAVRALGRPRIERWAARAAELQRSRRLLVVVSCAALVPVAAAAVASLAWRPEKVEWRGAARAVESRVVAEDLLIFDTGRSEVGYLRYAARADDRVTLDAASREELSAAIAERGRAWLVLADARRETVARRMLPAGWREADRLYARGVQVVLLERGEPEVVHRTRRGGK